MTGTGWSNELKTSLKTQTATWLVAMLIGILGLFSARVTGCIRVALNRADLRTKQHEELAIEVSQYVFSAELNVEFIENDWTTKRTMTALLEQYNASLTTLRKKEFVYLAWLGKYWGKDQEEKYESFMASLRTFDTALHSLNDEFEAVNIEEEKKKVSRERAEEALKLLKPAAEDVREKGRALLMSLA